MSGIQKFFAVIFVIILLIALFLVVIKPVIMVKYITLAKKLTDYVGNIKLHVISFTQVQEEIHRCCKEEYMITIMRRIMMRVASKICDKYNLGCIVTGESLGQVASQTMQSMAVTTACSTKPIFRPCIAMDKEDIMNIAKSIDTYQTSILPYEDCCTVFLPKNPLIKPKEDRVENEEKNLNISDLVISLINCIAVEPDVFPRSRVERWMRV